MDPAPSNYYPPRAPWYRTLREIGLGFLRGTRMDRFRTPGRIPFRSFMLGLALPGHAFLTMRLPTYGWAVMMGWFGLLFSSLIGLGTAWSGVGIGLMIFLHASSILFLIRPWLGETGIGTRLITSVITAIALIQFAYLPLQDLAERLFFLPLQYSGRPVVIRPWSTPPRLRPGDWVAYRIDPHRSSAPRVMVHEGYGLGPILAVAGDTVVFGPDAIRVNGVAFPRQASMPASGEVRLLPGHRFIWPQLQEIVRRGVEQESVNATLISLAQVPDDALVGQPYGRWFFRKQRLP